MCIMNVRGLHGPCKENVVLSGSTGAARRHGKLMRKTKEKTDGNIGAAFHSLKCLCIDVVQSTLTNICQSLCAPMREWI